MTKTFQKDNLRVHQFATRSDMGAKAAENAAQEILELLRNKPKVVLMFASAPSQAEFLEGLAADKRIDWSRIVAVHLDEYMNFDPAAPQGFARFLLDRIFLKVSPGECLLMQCGCTDTEQERLRYEQVLQENPIDIAFIGIGENGHIAFNEPKECNFNDPMLVREVTLDLKSRQQQVNDGCFKTLEEVPKTALTATVPAIMGAKRILCMVPAASKAKAVYDALNTDIGEHCPATVLRKHPNVDLYLDADSAALL